MSVRLVPLTAGEGPIVALQRPVVLIGRHPECDVRLDKPEVSRRHCCLALAYDLSFVGLRLGWVQRGENRPETLPDEWALSIWLSNRDLVRLFECAIEADLVLLAIGFNGPVRDELLEGLPVRFDAAGAITSDNRFCTDAPGVYVAGDARRGASLIVWAIAEGRKAAAEIDRALAVA